MSNSNRDNTLHSLDREVGKEKEGRLLCLKAQVKKSLVVTRLSRILKYNVIL